VPFGTGLEAVWASEVMLNESGGRNPVNMRVIWDMMPNETVSLSRNTECSGTRVWERQMCRSACFS
jgi:hypothetical protein